MELDIDKMELHKFFNSQELEVIKDVVSLLKRHYRESTTLKTLQDDIEDSILAAAFQDAVLVGQLSIPNL